jgi:sugar lactone lactonase YvrE
VNRLLIVIACGVASAALAACGSGSESQPATPEAPPAASPTAAPGAGRVTAGWTVTEAVETPESVYVDAPSGSIFVSMIAGQPGDRDGNGRIMRLAPDGSVVSASWVTGLNAPKGLRSHNGTLWTADIDEVIGIDIAKASITSRIKIDGAQFLNDVAVGEDGTVYVSDMLASRLYAVKDGKASVFGEGDAMEYPNGLLVEGNRLIVGGWGKPEADFSTKVPGHLFAIDLQTKAKTLITPKPLGNIDGVESDGRGGYVVTDWPAGRLLHVTSAGESRTLREFMPGAADHAFVPVGNIAIVPHMMENRIAAYDLTEVLKN